MNWQAIHLHALVHECKDVATSNQLLDGASQTLSQSAEKIQSHDHEVFVRGLVLVWLWLMKLEEREVVEKRRLELWMLIFQNKKKEHKW